MARLDSSRSLSTSRNNSKTERMKRRNKVRRSKRQPKGRIRLIRGGRRR